MMKELGDKHICFKCQTKFYDLKKPAPICPKCGADQRDAPPVSKTDRKKVVPAAPSRLEAVGEAEEGAAKEKDEDDEEEDEDEEEDDA
jgi:uncharacterized protein (TIGR02300 family)